MTRHKATDRSYIDRRVESIEAAELLEPVRAVLGDPQARVDEWRSAAVAYDFVNPSSGGVYRFSGTAAGRDGSVEWRLVLKVTRSTESLEHDAPLPPNLADALAQAVRWDREQFAFESGFLAQLEGPLAAPRSFGWTRNDDETGWLWLEDLTGLEGGAWPVERYGEVGRALGLFNGRFPAERHMADHPWLGVDWLRVWVLQITPFWFGGFRDSTVWDRPAVGQAYPKLLRERLLALWADRQRLLDALAPLPRTCSHLDAHRRNLFVRGDDLIAIDWGLLGVAPPGEEIASTLVGTVASGELRAEEARRLTSHLFDGYLDGLRVAGWGGAEHDIRLAFCVASALRVFSILGLDATDEAQLARSAALAAVLLDLGDEARALT